MNRWLSGPHIGEEIMTMTSVGHWRDYSNNINVICVKKRTVLGVFQPTTYRVLERDAIGSMSEWLSTPSFDHAIRLAERLVVGKEYMLNTLTIY